VTRIEWLNDHVIRKRSVDALFAQELLGGSSLRTRIIVVLDTGVRKGARDTIQS
jgi:hypothetical protein